MYNDYLEIVFDIGFFGLLLFVVVIVWWVVVSVCVWCVIGGGEVMDG